MGWARCGTDDPGRMIGYAIRAECDEPGCDATIDRGLSYVCGGMHGGDEHGCGGYFCGQHLWIRSGFQLCRGCSILWDLGHPDEDV